MTSPALHSENLAPAARLLLERVTRIELALSAWEADVLPLNYTRDDPRAARRRLPPGGRAEPVRAGRIRLFAGLRSDPFFADVEGALHGLEWTGHDDFADNSVDSIVLEVPNDMLGADPLIGVWATISLRRDGALVQMDRGGNPTINPFINPDGEKNLFNSRQPADDIANYLGPWSAVLESGGYAPEEAKAAAMQVLPDILRYDRAKPAAYPNGRALADDVFSMRFAWLTHGKVPPTGLTPHDDLLAEFPYLGPPAP